MRGGKGGGTGCDGEMRCLGGSNKSKQGREGETETHPPNKVPGQVDEARPIHPDVSACAVVDNHVSANGLRAASSLAPAAAAQATLAARSAAFATLANL